MSAPSNLFTRDAIGRAAHSKQITLAQGLGWFSICLGVAELVAPGSLCRAAGFRGRETLVQVYGLRELATGAAILASRDPTPWIWGRILGDAVDIATLATGLREDNPNRANLVLAIAAVAGVTLLDAICVQELSHAESHDADPQVFDYRARTGFPRPAAAMRGAASGFIVPVDFRIPAPLRPWTVDERTSSQIIAEAPIT